MSIFQTILQQFQKLSLNQNSKLNQSELSQSVSHISKNNTNLPYFDPEILQQFWQHSNKTPDLKVKIKDYIQTIIDARNILNENIVKCQQQLKYEDNSAKQEQLKQYLVSYKQDLQIISDTFQLQIPSPGISKLNSLVQQSSPPPDQQSELIADIPSPRQQSTSLKMVLILTTIMVLLQLLCMQARDHFMNILVYIAIVCIFFRGYFDRTYMRTILVLLAVTFLLDIAWLIVQAPYYWYQSKVNILSNRQPGFLITVYILTFFLMAAKIFIFVLLFRFRKNDFMTKKSVSIFNYKLQLNAKQTDNPITAILGDSGNSTNSYD